MKINLIFVILISFLIFLFTLAPTVTFIDSGEMAAVSYTLGIGHPTGSPFYTLIGWVFSHLPFGESVIYRLNLMSALFASLAVGILFLLLFDLFKNNVIASFGAFLFAFTKTFWSQALITEVYSLQILISLGVLYFAIKAKEQKWKGIHPYLSALLLGLGFSNHMTTIFLLPALIYLYFSSEELKLNSFLKSLRFIIPFLLSLAFYLYLPLRAIQQPFFNWGDPSTLKTFIWHITGKQYRVSMFTPPAVMWEQFIYFLKMIPKEFLYFPLIFIPFGWLYFFKNKRQFFILTIILFISVIGGSITYETHDIDSYFILAFLCLNLWMVGGIKFIIDNIIITRKRNIFIILLFLIFALYLTFFAYFNGKEVSQRDNYLVHDYTHNLLSCLNKNAIIISRQWEFFVSPFWYFQAVEKIRPDVILIEQELLRRSWYLKHLKQHYPRLYQKSEKEIEAFLKELYKFENGLPYSPEVIQNKYIAMLNSFIARNIDFQPIYITIETEPDIGKNFAKIPEGLAFRLYKKHLYYPYPFPNFTYRSLHRSDLLSEYLKSLYATMFIQRVVYLIKYGKRNEAEGYLKEAKKFPSKPLSEVIFR